MMEMGDSQKEQGLIAEVVGPDLTLELEENHSKLVRTHRPVLRSSVIDPSVVEVTQFDPKNLEIIGLKAGYTDLTLWFAGEDQLNDAKVLRYRVHVTETNETMEQRQLEYRELETMINELYPNSSIELILVADKLIVRGQARDSQETTEIMSLIRRRGISGGSAVGGGGAVSANSVMGKADVGNQSATNILNMIRIPGEQQVLLKVRVAEISRSALREIGLDFSFTADNLHVSSSLENAGNLIALLKGDEVSLMLKAVSSNAYSKILAEPNLVTLSGRTASFIAGGQFAVPTAVGLGGVAAATTSFQGFGTQLQFTPTVIDKDRIRLRVAPTFSSLNQGNSVNGIPGLNTRSVFTTVDMREGQWLAVAGLIEEKQSGSKLRVPGIGDIPIGGLIFGRNSIKRDETELLILVSPQLIHPMDAECVPSILPGMDVLEPNNHEFFLGNQIEGLPLGDFRSTTTTAAPNRGPIQVQHAQKKSMRYRESQDFYLQSLHGFAE